MYATPAVAGVGAVHGACTGTSQKRVVPLIVIVVLACTGMGRNHKKLEAGDGHL